MSSKFWKSIEIVLLGDKKVWEAINVSNLASQYPEDTIVTLRVESRPLYDISIKINIFCSNETGLKAISYKEGFRSTPCCEDVTILDDNTAFKIAKNDDKLRLVENEINILQKCNSEYIIKIRGLIERKWKFVHVYS